MDNFVLCSGVITFFLLLFGLIIALRYMSYRETLALAEKGLVRPEKRNGKGALVWGISFAAVGAALCVGLLPIGFWVDNTGRFGPLGLMGPWLLVGLLPMFFGVGLILIHVLTREPKPADESRSAASTTQPSPSTTPLSTTPPAPSDATKIEPPPAQP